MIPRAGRRVWQVVVAAAVLCAPSAAIAQSPSPSPLSALVTEVLALFPKVDGDVIEVRPGEVTIALGKREGIQPGIELSLYRPGRELRHPKTGEVLGHTEQSLGRVRIKETFEAYSIAALPSGRSVVAGDRARISSGPISVTLVPLVERVNRSLAEAASQELFEALSKTGRFRVSWGDQVATLLGQQQVKPDDFLAGERVPEIAARLKTDYLLALRFRVLEKKPFVDVRLFTPSQRDPLLTTAFYVPASIRPAEKAGFSGGGDQRGKKVVKERSLLARLLSGESDPLTYSSGEGAIPLKELARFPFVAVGFDVAVSPKDGVARLVITDGEKIYLYRITDDRLEPEWTYNVRAFGTIFSLQLADLDGDGVFEVVVNRYHFSSMARSLGMVGFILGQKNGRPQMLVDDVDSILVAVDDTGAGVKRTLWGQPYDSENFFTPGKFSQFGIKDGRLVTLGSPPRVPNDLRATGITFSNLSGKTGPRTLVYIDASRRLRLAAEGEELWRSTTSVGGGGAKLELTIMGSRDKRSQFFFIEPLPLAVDLDGDGVDEVIIPQNVQQPGLLAVVYRGPAGFRIQSINSGFEGTILGMGAIRGERPTLVAAVVHQKGLLAKGGETQIIVTAPSD